jgi:hypothetical protein
MLEVADFILDLVKMLTISLLLLFLSIRGILQVFFRTPCNFQ